MSLVAANLHRFRHLLKTSILQRDISLGKALQSLYIKAFIPQSTYLSNHFIIFYAKIGDTSDAHKLFDEIPHPNVFSYNTIISAYARESHTHIARELFELIPQPDLVSYNTLISSYAATGDIDFAIDLFFNLRNTNIGLDGFTLSSLITAYSDDVLGVKQVHCLAVTGGFDSYVSVNNALITNYSKNGFIDDAQCIFNWMDHKIKDEVTWNSMIVAYGQHKEGSKALVFFREMVSRDLRVDAYTFASLLTAFNVLEDLRSGIQFHSHLVKIGLEWNCHVGSGLIDLYSKCSSIKDAKKVFEEVKKPDLVIWNTMISGFSQNIEFSEEALEYFRGMQQAGLRPDDCSFVCVMSACSNLSSPSQGKQLHSLAIKSDIPMNRISINNALVAVYAKSGNLTDARLLFDKMPERNSVTYNSIIAGYAHHGRGLEALDLFDQMLETGNTPTCITFISVLSACAHTGKVDNGWKYFNSMDEKFSIQPSKEHYSCMIDLLGRAGRFEEVNKLIDAMPFDPDAIAWAALLGACRTHGNVELGTKVAKELLKLEPDNAAGYVMLSNIYADAGKWEEAASVRKIMRDRRVKKKPGCSWIEINKKVHAFVAEDNWHPRIKEIYAFLDELTGKIKQVGYVPDIRWALIRDEKGNESEKEMRLLHHSERIAVAFGLISAKEGEPIMVVKNLRICADCHNFVKHVSAIVGREITVRDAHRFHCFKEGICSCGDYW